jgi:hypothetical protein
MYFNINDLIAVFIILQPFIFQYNNVTFILFTVKKIVVTIFTYNIYKYICTYILLKFLFLFKIRFYT